MLSKFFLDRPVFAWVIAIVIMALGVIAIYILPVSQYPQMAPPSIAITASYPGASSETVENSVTQVIEQKMTGLDNLLYMSASSDSAGGSRLELTFAPGTDPDIAWSKVQNKVQSALPSLPDVVENQGVQVSKSTRNYLMIVGLISEDASMDGTDLRDYAKNNLEKILARVPGVGEVEVFGGGYAMRVWLNPHEMTQYHLTVDDVLAALKSYNVEVSAGQFGGAPAVPGQRLNASIVVQNMLSTPEEFAAIPLRTNPDGSIVRIRDVGRTELGTEIYDIQVSYSGKPSAGIAIRQSPGANALDTADAVKAKMAEMSRFFPAGLKVVYPNDTTTFIKVSINEVIKTLVIAFVLVFLVMWLFLGNVRATLIPTIAVPVVLLGTFAVLALFGFTVNMLTMFAMVLAIGLLVDDAIVVVENVERIMSEEGLPPKEATAKSMDQITSALVGIGLVLSAVFGPMAFFPGSTGVIYRQFSITIISAMLLSVAVALILTPVLCAGLLKPVPAGHEPAQHTVFFLRSFFRWFDRVFFGLRDRYIGLVGNSLTRKKRYLIVFLVIVAVMGVLWARMPRAYLPDEDQGILLAQVIMPTGATLEQTGEITQQIQKYFEENEKEAVESVMTITGVGFSGRAQNNGMVFIRLKDWHLRPGGSESEGDRRPRDGGSVPHPQRHGVYLPTSGRCRTGHVHGIRFSIAGPRRDGAFGADERSVPAARPCRQRSPGRQSPAQQHGRRARIPHRRGLGKSRGSGRSHLVHPQNAVRSLRQRLRQRFHSGRAHQKSVHSGRRALSHAAQRSGKALCPKYAGPDGAFFVLCRGPVDVRSAPADAVQRLSRHQHLGRTGPRLQFGRSHARHGGSHGETSFRLRLRLERTFLPGADGQHPGAAFVCVFDLCHFPLSRGSV